MGQKVVGHGLKTCLTDLLLLFQNSGLSDKEYFMKSSDSGQKAQWKRGKTLKSWLWLLLIASWSQISTVVSCGFVLLSVGCSMKYL